MERAEFVAILTPLVQALRADFDKPSWTAYYHALKEDISPRLLQSAVRRAIQTRTFMPRPAELLQDAEVCRRELIEAHPYERCADCNHIGRVSAGLDDKGIPQYRRCKCWDHYQQRLSQLGIGSEPLALPEPELRTQAGEAQG